MKRGPELKLRPAIAFVLAEWTGLEPATPGVTGRYSNQLNYHSALVKPRTVAQQSVAIQGAGA